MAFRNAFVALLATPSPVKGAPRKRARLLTLLAEALIADDTPLPEATRTTIEAITKVTLTEPTFRAAARAILVKADDVKRHLVSEQRAPHRASYMEALGNG